MKQMFDLDSLEQIFNPGDERKFNFPNSKQTYTEFLRLQINLPNKFGGKHVM